MDNSTTYPSALAGMIDRLERVPRYLGCVAALAGSARDLNVVSGDDLAMLLDLITQETEQAIAMVRLELARA